MKRRLFDSFSQHILLSPEHWKYVGSAINSEIRPISATPQQQTWLESHVENHIVREVFIGLKGTGHYGFRGNLYPCSPGTVFMFDANEPHADSYLPGGSSMLQLWFFIFKHDVISQLRRVVSGKIVSNTSPTQILTGSPSSTLLIETWDNIAGRGSSLPLTVKRALLSAALAAVFADLVTADCAHEENLQKDPPARAVVQAIQRHIAENPERKLSLGEAARLAGYSKYHFARLFKQHSGQTYLEYLDICRYRYVTASIGSGMRTKDIAYKLGFSHPSAYLRWLKKME